jgi:hypothetical protein
MIFVDYPGHLVAGLLVAVFGALTVLAFRIGKIRNTKPRRHELPLILLQYGSILILLLILWNPSRAKVTETLSNSSILAIFDTSESMSLVEDGKLTRLDKALNVFKEKFQWSEDDGAGYRIFGFDSQSYHSGSRNFLRHWGKQTDMHSAFAALSRYGLSEASIAASDSQSPNNGTSQSAAMKDEVIGAVIFTDGQADDKNIDTYHSPADKSFQTVLVGVGSRETPADIAVTSVNAPRRMAIDTACNIAVGIAAKNLQQEQVTVELLKDDLVIASQKIPAGVFNQKHSVDGSFDKSVDIEFAAGADSLGSYVYSVRAKMLEREVNRANNLRSTVIEVVEETRLNVLLYSQVANFNIGKIRQALSRDSKIQLDLSLDVIRNFDLGDKASDMCGYVKLPTDRRGFYKYDIIVLGPCDMAALTNVQIDGLYSFVVDRGGGLVLLPGKVEFGPAAWTRQKAKALVPVVFDIDEPTIWPSTPDKLKLTLEGVDSNIIGPDALKDYDEPTLPYHRIGYSKPAATTLATVNETPVITIHRIGRGRVCLLNAARLFRWYREDLGGGLLYKTMAGLTGNLGKITKREAGIELFAERPETEADKVRFQAYVCDDSFKPVNGANVLLSIGDQVLSMGDRGQGHYIASIKDRQSQTFVATAQAEIDGVFLGEKTIAVDLPPVRDEMANADLDEQFLRALAAKVNGKYYHIDDIKKNVEQIFKADAGVASSRRMTSIWPNWFLLAVLCMMLCTSWFLRRSIGLV